jgi:hypothetical protein
MLSGARAAAAGILDPFHAEEALKYYQGIEMELFGELGPMNPGEIDLTRHFHATTARAEHVKAELESAAAESSATESQPNRIQRE